MTADMMFEWSAIGGGAGWVRQGECKEKGHEANVCVYGERGERIALRTVPMHTQYYQK